MGHAVGDSARRSIEAIRRGSVRAGCSPIVASSWEHIEVVLLESTEVEHVSTLTLRSDSTFRAEVYKRSKEWIREETLSRNLSQGPACGCWRPCGRGVELTFAAEEELGLEELVVLYRSKRGDFLVAEESWLPEGLAQARSFKRRDSTHVQTDPLRSIPCAAPPQPARRRRDTVY